MFPPFPETQPLIPQRLRIRREANYHTHFIGKTDTEHQFMAFIVAVLQAKGTPPKNPAWYAVLHEFDHEGHYIKTQAEFLGIKAMASELKRADNTLEQMIKKLGRVHYSDIEVELFSTQINGHIFGLIDASVPAENYARIDLVPNQLAFFPPWDGTYST